jgi:bifunctional oligoribonuclease and PAP phosphatase NrnA
MSNSLAGFCKAIKHHRHFALASHVNPEGDSVGSILAINSLLKRIGKKTTIVCQDTFPKRLRCLPRNGWHQASQMSTRCHFDALMLLDCPTLERIGTVQKFLGAETAIFNIDHHVSNLQFGDYNYVRPEAAACGEVVYDIFKWFKLPITAEEAKALYVSISTDTGSFKYANTSSKCHLIAAELIKTGIDVEAINDCLFETYSLEKTKLYSRLLSRIKKTRDGKIAWVALKRDDLRKTGSTYEDAEGFIDFLKYLREVDFSFFMIELHAPPPGQVRVSFRSKGKWDVSEIAAHFGGGGHKKAAGCVMMGSLRDVGERIHKRIQIELMEKCAGVRARRKRR